MFTLIAMMGTPKLIVLTIWSYDTRDTREAAPRSMDLIPLIMINTLNMSSNN